MSANNAAPASITIPTVKRRLISMIYEILLAFAVLFLPLLLVEFATRAAVTPFAWHIRQATTFLVLAVYFVHQWSRKGQTLAMQTWRIKLVVPGRHHVPLQLAVVRYLLSWMWVLPAVLASYIFKLEHWHVLYALLAGVLLWSLTAFFSKDRQFLHDRLAGTRLVQLPKPEKKQKAVA
jgi:uncharacterized RDD family membrane protein YckC